MEFLVRKIHPNEVEQEITQRDQFDTDAVGLAETLVRESLQNSTDGRSIGNDKPVRTRIHIIDARDSYRDFWKALYAPMLPHLTACRISLEGIDLSMPRLLIIEDFGTTGLLGSTNSKDDRNFSDFWRRMGRSHKKGEQGGRWGLGKLVFSSASRIRTLFGVTVQEDDPTRTRFLMGQSVLKSHRLEASPVEFAPHAFFARRGLDDLQLPEGDQAFVSAFCEAADLERTTEPGLSIVVPFVRDEITAANMLPHVIRNWFFPILTGRLIVEIGDFMIDQHTFAALAREHGGEEFADGRRVNFISELYAARDMPPAVVLPKSWIGDQAGAAITAEVLEGLRTDYSNNKLVAVRVPLSIRPRSGNVEQTYFDLYLQQHPNLNRGEAFFVRGSITIPGEAQRFRRPNCMGALVAEDRVVAAFLGDSEGPAHTTWSGTAEKARENWRNARERLKEIRGSLESLYLLVAQVKDELDPTALMDLFFVDRGGPSKSTRQRNPIVLPPKPLHIVPKPPNYAITPRQGGFAVRGVQGMQLPLELRVRMAYDVVDGNPLAQYSRYDFDITSKDMEIDAEGAHVAAASPNELRIHATAADFKVMVLGFDLNRDLFIKAERQS